MNYKEIRNTLEQMLNDNYEDFTKALIGFEKGINDKEALDKLYQDYMGNDSMGLLNDEFDYMIDELRENGQIKESTVIEKEDNNLVNIIGNIVGEVETIERENKNGETFKVANFSVVSKDDEGKKVYHNCSANGEKSDIPKDFKQGDFVKLFGQLITSIDDNGKEHSNVRILSSKLLKAKEKNKNQEEKKESVIGSIKKFKSEEKLKTGDKKEISKETER
ncbi:DNA-binding protein [Peptoniphilus asaccharolyticus]